MGTQVWQSAGILKIFSYLDAPFREMLDKRCINPPNRGFFMLSRNISIEYFGVQEKEFIFAVSEVTIRAESREGKTKSTLPIYKRVSDETLFYLRYRFINIFI